MDEYIVSFKYCVESENGPTAEGYIDAKSKEEATLLLSKKYRVPSWSVYLWPLS